MKKQKYIKPKVKKSKLKPNTLLYQKNYITELEGLMLAAKYP
jgi:hypothetical protein